MKIIYAIPGIGTTEKLFQYIKIPNYEIKVLNWPIPKKEYTMADYAREFLNQIDSSSPVYLMGVSFGGMLCSQISDFIPCEKIILISSCRDNSQFPFLLRFAKTIPLYKLISENFLAFLAKSQRWILGRKKSLDPMFIAMINQMPKNYFKYCIGYIVNWDKTSDKKENLIQIHGTKDRLLPYKRIESCISVEGGGHVMIISKAIEINLILNSELNNY